MKRSSKKMCVVKDLTIRSFVTNEIVRKIRLIQPKVITLKRREGSVNRVMVFF